MLRYRCLVLDHDDTTVDSTRSVNYPQFREALAHFRPDMSMTEEEYFLYIRGSRNHLRFGRLTHQ